MSKETAAMVRFMERECTKRNIDITRAVIFASGGTIYVNGIIKKIRGHTFDLEHELGIVTRVVKSKPGVQGIVYDIDIRE
ncbi:MAG: hypothetical protein WCT06_02625 [Armatimonadota bacterium]|jgi:hypothetical protein